MTNEGGLQESSPATCASNLETIFSPIWESVEIRSEVSNDMGTFKTFFGYSIVSFLMGDCF